MNADLLAESLRRKEACRREAKAMTWPQKIAAIERMREASALARAGMRATRACRVARSAQSNFTLLGCCQDPKSC